ncbi:MAG: extracellular solute-binding protein [Treponema sp.]|jgi:putative aldouronate transport system substrate-binding protein|nr:extracellular solute-binding protein [Treponema sp.]
MKKKLLSALGILLIAFLFLSNGDQDSSSPVPETFTPTGRLTVEVFDRGTDGGKSLAHDNAWTNWIKEKVKRDLNIDVTFIPVGRWSENTDIVNLMAAGPGSAPDLCYTYAYDMIAAFRDQGGVLDLAPYVDNYLPDLKALLGRDPSFAGREFIYRNRDPNTGKLYYISGYRVALAQRNVFIRKDWLDALGLRVPTNFNEFYQALVAFRDRDPGNVGKNRVVPLGVNEDARWGLADLIQNFLNPRMSDRDRWVYNIADRYIYMDGYKRGVQEMNKWYNEGLIFHDFPLMRTADDFYNQIKSGVVGAFNQNWDFPYRTDINIMADLRRNVPNADYIPIDVVANRDMMDKVGIHIFIPSFSPNKDSALKYLNWLAKPENYSFLQIGREGVNHRMVNGIPQTIATPPQSPWIQNSPNNIDYTLPINGVELGSPELNGRALGLGYGNTPPEVVANAFIVSTRNARSPAVYQATTTVNRYASDLQEKATDLIALAIKARPQDFSRVWDNGIRDWLRSGGQAVFNERSSLYPRR